MFACSYIIRRTTHHHHHHHHHPRWTRSFSIGNDWSTLGIKATSITDNLAKQSETIGVAETATGGLISAALWSAPSAARTFKGAGVRLVYGINRKADAEGVKTARDFVASTPAEAGSGWPLVYEDGDEHSETGTAVHALELAYSAKFNLGTTWGIGESGIAGPEAHQRTGMPAGIGFVAVAGPTKETTGVLKVNEGGQSRAANMARFTNAALDLMGHLQSKHMKSHPNNQPIK